MAVVAFFFHTKERLPMLERDVGTVDIGVYTYPA